MGIELVGVPAVGHRIYIATGSMARADFDETRWFKGVGTAKNVNWHEFENLNWILDLDESFAGNHVRVEMSTKDGRHFSASAGPIISAKQVQHFLKNYSTDYQLGRIDVELKHLQQAHQDLLKVKNELSVAQRVPEKLEQIAALESRIREQTELQKRFAEADSLLSRADQLKEEMAQRESDFAERISIETEALESARREQIRKLADERKAWGDKLSGQRIELAAQRTQLSEQIEKDSANLERKRVALIEAEKRFFADTDLVRRLRELESRESRLREGLLRIESHEREFQQKADKLSSLAETLSESKRLDVKINADAPAGILMSKIAALDEVFGRENSKARVAFERERRLQVKSELPDPIMCTACNIPLNACGCGS